MLADYAEAHHTILPKQYFTLLRVEEGGHGTGTVFTVHLSVLGVVKVFHMTASEPEPGRVMIEADEDAGAVTTFTVDPLAGGAQSRVTMATDVKTSPGLMGIVEKWLDPILLGRVLRAELAQLDQVMRARKSSA